MITLTYPQLSDAGRLTQALIAAGLVYAPPSTGRFYGVSVDSSVPNTLVYVPDDATAGEIALIAATVLATPATPLPPVPDPTYPQILLFFATGYFRPATGIDIQEPKQSYDVSQVVVRREIAGTSGTTEIDILVNGVSMFVPANRPKIIFSLGDAARVSVVPDTAAIASTDRVEMVIVTAEDGDPQDLVAELIPS